MYGSPRVDIFHDSVKLSKGFLNGLGQNHIICSFHDIVSVWIYIVIMNVPLHFIVKEAK